MLSLLLFLSYCAVYPPRSMDGAEYTWDLGESVLSSFMASYSPVPVHLRKRKNVVGEDERGDERVDLSEDTDIAGEEEDPGIEDEGVLEPDPSDDALIANPSSEQAGALSTGGLRNRRRLVKGGAHVSVSEPMVGPSKGAALDIPVSDTCQCNYKYC